MRFNVVCWRDGQVKAEERLGLVLRLWAAAGVGTLGDVAPCSGQGVGEGVARRARQLQYGRWRCFFSGVRPLRSGACIG